LEAQVLFGSHAKIPKPKTDASTTVAPENSVELIDNFIPPSECGELLQSAKSHIPICGLLRTWHPFAEEISGLRDISTRDW
jgi:hypothetical protein